MYSLSSFPSYAILGQMAPPDQKTPDTETPTTAGARPVSNVPESPVSNVPESPASNPPSPVSKELWRLYEASGLKSRIQGLAAQLVDKTFAPGPRVKAGRIRHDDPYIVLGVSPDDSPEMVDAVFRAKARILHPDKGGNPAAFSRLKIAYDQIRKARR